MNVKQKTIFSPILRLNIIFSIIILMLILGSVGNAQSNLDTHLNQSLMNFKRVTSNTCD